VDVPSPKELAAAKIGGGDYVAVGDEFLGHLKDLANLQPQHRVLEMGCGIGRIARPLTEWLQPPGSYDGFDVQRRSIEWCRAHITQKHPHFRFHHVDVANSYYNATGASDASTLRFPFESDSFDVVMAVSVFTHLVPAAATRYLLESARVLKPGGVLFATWFAYSDADVEQCASTLKKVAPLARGTHRVASVEAPEAVVAFPDQFVAAAYDRAALTITRRVTGNWRQAAHVSPYQDMVVAAKPVL
jgi:SAM-dependent methyltransferase